MQFMQVLTVKGFVMAFGVGAVSACSHAANTERSVPQGSAQQSAQTEWAEQNSVVEAPGVLRSWFQPPPEEQHPYVPPPQKRYVPLGGDSTGPVIVLPGGNGPQSD